MNSLPVFRSTLVSFDGHLAAVGGDDGDFNPTNSLYMYDSHTDSWNIFSQMKKKRSNCLAVTLPDDQITVVGGYTSITPLHETDSVEILT